jgi:hypothetical protein
MRYRYLKDPLFLFCLVVYFANRWILKVHFSTEFSHNYLNDLICLPFWIPIMLFLMRKTGLRRNDAPPQGLEILLPLFIWSWAFEVYLPRQSFFEGLAFSDPLDILCYTAGACAAAIFWTYWYRPRALVA